MKTTHYFIHNKVIEFGTIDWAFYNPHSHVTIQQKGRKDTILDSSVERDMVYNFLSTKVMTIPLQHYMLIFAGFIEKHQLVCCVVCGHIQNPFHVIGVVVVGCNLLEAFMCEGEIP